MNTKQKTDESWESIITRATTAEEAERIKAFFKMNGIPTISRQDDFLKSMPIAIILTQKKYYLNAILLHEESTGIVNIISGEVVREAVWNKLKRDWCTCEKDEFLCYPEDGQCTCGIYLHHVHCAICRGVSQIG